MSSDRIGVILQGIILEPVPADLSDRHPNCPPTGCWGHELKLNRSGYRQVKVGGKMPQLHRFVYETLRAPIPKGLTLDHLCRNPACCNPDHLEAVPPGVNSLRSHSPPAVNAAKTHCPRGHPYGGENLYVCPDGRRHCRECSKERQRRQREQNPEAHRERQRRFRQRNPEAHRGAVRRWCDQNPEAIREKRRRYRARKRALRAAQEPTRLTDIDETGPPGWVAPDPIPEDHKWQV